jgi:hypothetical protein
MSFGKGSSTTTSTQSPNPAAMAAYNGLLSRAGQIASTPYQAYTGEGVAGINAQQMLGIGNINAGAGFASPYIQQATQYANQAAQPLTASQIQQYESPYTQSVINATQNQFNTQNAQQQSQVMGDAAAQGALGGNRAGVAQALTAGQQQQAQAPVIAGLQNQGYQTGLQTALAEQQNLGQAAYSLGNLGVAGQNAALTGANAQIGAGTLQQQTQQALDQYLYGQYAQQQAYPYQQLSWLAGIDTGVGSQMGGTSSTTGPAPNPWNALLGLGAVGLSAWGGGKARGGKVAGFGRHYDGGGGVAGMPWAGAPSWIPAMQITHGSGPPKPPSLASQSQQNPFGNPQQLAKGITGLGKSVGNAWTNSSAGDAVQDAMQDMEEDSAGGAVFKRGGVAGFADGGSPDYGDLEGGFDPDVGAFSPTPGLGAPISFLPGTRFGAKDDDKPLGSGTYSLGDIGPGTGFDFNPTRTDANTLYDNVADVPLPRARPDIAPDLPPGESVPERRVAGLNVSDDRPTGGLGIRPGAQGAPDLPAQSKEAGFGGLFHLSDAARTGLMAAGLGMMASRSPFLANAIGEGGLAGMSAYSGTKHEEATAQQVAEKLKQHAEETRKKLEIESAREARMAAEQESREKDRQLGLMKPMVIDKDPYGQPIYGRMDPKGNLFTMDGNPYTAQQKAKAEANANLTGGAYIDTIPREDQNQVRQAGQYMATIPSANSRSPQAQRLRNEIFQAYPDIDERMYGAQSAAVRKFWSGPDSDTIKSFNVAISHLDTLQNAANALKNGDIQLFNKIANAYKSATGQAMPTDFNAVRDIVADEIVKGIVGSRAGVTEREEAHRRIAAEFSQGQFDSVINRYKELMGGQMNGLRQKFVSTTGLNPEVFDRFLLPETKQALTRHEQSGAAPPPSGPPRVDKAGYDALPRGAQYTAPDGSVRTKQ